MNSQNNEKQSIVKKIVQNEKVIMLCLAIIPFLYAGLNAIYNIAYKYECEKFYGVPRKYFASSVDDRILYTFCIIFVLMLGVVPIAIKKYNVKNNSSKKECLLETAILSIVIGLEIGIVNVSNLLEILRQVNKSSKFFKHINYWLYDKAIFITLTVIVLGIVSVFGITAVEEISNIKRNWIKKIVCIVLSVALVGNLGLMFYGTVLKLSISIEDKTRYEFVTLDKEYVVLSLYNEKSLIAPAEVDKNGKYIFRTTQYRFIDSYKGTYQYKDIESTPFIESNLNR